MHDPARLTYSWGDGSPVGGGYRYPRYTGLRRELDTYLDYYNNDRAHTGRHAHGRIPGDIVYRARKMEVR